MSNIEDTLKERGSTYGHFPNVAYTSQTIRSCMTEFDGWDNLNDTQREALTVIAQKIARILNGNPDYVDNWHDIAGYATLVEKSLTNKEDEAVLSSLSQIKEGQYYVTTRYLDLVQVSNTNIKSSNRITIGFNVIGLHDAEVSDYYIAEWSNSSHFNDVYQLLQVDSLDQAINVVNSMRLNK